MSDPLNEIISMSNDDSISSKEKKVVDDDGDVGEGGDVDDVGDTDMSDDTDEGDMGGDTDDTDDGDSGGGRNGKRRKSGKKKHKKYSETPLKKKSHKINKKKLARELRNNKLRQIKVSLPYTVKSDRAIDYNKSVEVSKDENGAQATAQQDGKVKLYQKRWFRVLILVLVVVVCSLFLMGVSITAYRHILRKSHSKLLTDDVESGGGKSTSTSTSTSASQTQTKEEEDPFAQPNYDKMLNDLGKGIKGGGKKSNNSSPTTSTPSSTRKSNLPLRDSKGRFISRKNI